MCDDYCASYLYGNQSAGLCKPCPIGCVRCQPMDPDTCTECDSSLDFRELVNSSCECIKGYYELTVTSLSCTACVSEVPFCGNCQLSLSFICD